MEKMVKDNNQEGQESAQIDQMKDDSIAEVDGALDSGYKFKLDDFEGSLDLLLHLIKISKRKIEDVFMSQITEQYLIYMQEIESVDLEKASEFIETAALLLEIKSKSLLPKPEVEVPPEEDPQKILIQRIEEYRLYKEASLKIKERETVGIHYRGPDDSVGDPVIVLKDMTMDGLMKALQKLFLKLETKNIVQKERKITLDRFTVVDKIMHIKDILLLRDKVSFFELFDCDYTKGEIITTFQALLELLKMQAVKAEQQDLFEQIIIYRVA